MERQRDASGARKGELARSDALPVAPFPSPDEKNGNDEKREARRQTAIATGSAVESRTSGPAKEMPSSESASTQYGLVDMAKKKSRCARHRLFFSGQPYSLFGVLTSLISAAARPACLRTLSSYR